MRVVVEAVWISLGMQKALAEVQMFLGVVMAIPLHMPEVGVLLSDSKLEYSQ